MSIILTAQARIPVQRGDAGSGTRNLRQEGSCSVALASEV